MTMLISATDNSVFPYLLRPFPKAHTCHMHIVIMAGVVKIPCSRHRSFFVERITPDRSSITGHMA